MSYKLTDLMEGAMNFVQGYGNVRRGEEVLVLTETAQDPLLSEAYAAAVRALGAKVYVLVMEEMRPKFGHRLFEDQIPPLLVQAFASVDVCINALRSFIHTNDGWLNRACIENGSRWIWPPLTVKELASPYGRFPAELAFALARKDYEKVARSKEVKVTDPKGTDITANIDLVYTVKGYAGMVRGAQTMIPGAWVGPNPVIGFIHRIPNARGTVYADMNELDLRKLDQPFSWEVEDGWVVKVEGETTEPWQEMIKEDKKFGLFSEIMWTYNPKQNIDEVWPDYDSITRKTGIVHMAIGSPPSRARGDMETASTHHLAHTHLLLIKPTVYVDDEPIIIDGHAVVLDDPEIRELAKKFGDPDELLSEIPFNKSSYMAGS